MRVTFVFILCSSIFYSNGQFSQGFESPGAGCTGYANHFNMPAGWTQLCTNNSSVLTTDCNTTNNWQNVNNQLSGPHRTGTNAFVFEGTGTAASPANKRYLISPINTGGTYVSSCWMKTTSSTSCTNRNVDVFWTTSPTSSVSNLATLATWEGTLNLIGSFTIPAGDCGAGCINVTTGWVQKITNSFTPGSNFYLVWRYNYATNGNCTPPLWLDDISLTVPLPLDLQTFEGNCLDYKTYLNWSVNENANFSHFVVQRSIDGVEFSDAGEVSATANLGNGNPFFFTDHFPETDRTNLYYRLKQVDFNGQVNISKVISVEICHSSSEQVLVFPNPGNGIFHLSIGKEIVLPKPIFVYSVLGELVHTETIASEDQLFNLSKVAPGVYYVSFDEHVKKVVKN